MPALGQTYTITLWRISRYFTVSTAVGLVRFLRALTVAGNLAKPDNVTRSAAYVASYLVMATTGIACDPLGQSGKHSQPAVAEPSNDVCSHAAAAFFFFYTLYHRSAGTRNDRRRMQAKSAVLIVQMTRSCP